MSWKDFTRMNHTLVTKKSKQNTNNFYHHPFKELCKRKLHILSRYYQRVQRVPDYTISDFISFIAILIQNSKTSRLKRHRDERGQTKWIILFPLKFVKISSISDIKPVSNITTSLKYYSRTYLLWGDSKVLSIFIWSQQAFK